MLFTSRINNIATAYPKLSRVWIKTADPRVPLKGVWTDESKLHCVTPACCSAELGDDPAELAEDHLRFQPWLSLPMIPASANIALVGCSPVNAFPSWETVLDNGHLVAAMR